MVIPFKEAPEDATWLPRLRSPDAVAPKPHQSIARQQTAVLLLHIGMPEAPTAGGVHRFTARFFSDPEVNRLPRILRWCSPIVGQVRAALVSSRLSRAFQRIWRDGRSPLETIAAEQSSALQTKLPAGMKVFHATRYGRPTVAETLKRIEALGFDALIAVCMYPQASGPTTRSMVRELYEQIEQRGCGLNVMVRNFWHDDAGYINAQARLIHAFASEHSLSPQDTQLVFSVRSIPVASIDQGDPYMDQIHRTAELVARRLGWPVDRVSLGYQGDHASKRWLQPTVSELLADLAQSGQKQVLVCPLGYTTDCLETLYDIGIRYRAQFESEGGRFFACPALNEDEPFISALRKLVLHGRHPISRRAIDVSLMDDDHDRQSRLNAAKPPIDSLVLVGISLPGRLGAGPGPTLVHTGADELRAIRMTQCEIPDLLRSMCQIDTILEAWLWNTCRRFEFYGWLTDDVGSASRDRVIAAICDRFSQLVAHDTAPVFNVLHGAEAWHHLMRTAVGLNSGLPGECDVLQQLQAAHRVAKRAGAAGPYTDHLLRSVLEHERELRQQTAWGSIGTSYCYASTASILQSFGTDISKCRCVVIGGSTTSCSMLEELAVRFGVPRRKLMLLHRGHGHGSHLTMLRKAIGTGRRIRVHKYNEKVVIRAIADADVLVIGLDRKESVLTAEDIRDCRDFTGRPLTIIDFNMFGSTTGMIDLAGVHPWTAEDLENAAKSFADDMCQSEQFTRAVEEVEAWIQNHLPESMVESAPVSQLV